MFERFFRLAENGTSVRTEVIAGLTTFLTMSYIIFVNPEILSTTGMDRDSVFVATCIAAALGSAVMALVANWPIGMAPGMGLNAFFAFTVVAALGFSWQQALGAVFISGIIFVILTMVGWAGWRSPAGALGTLFYGGYGTAFMIAGRPENYYWGVMIVPALLIGLAFAPRALVSLVRAARRDGPQPAISSIG